MLKITQHIERLLLHNDCVIIPDFGGFVVQECSARYVEEEGIFLPPYRGVIFNPRLTSNDGLLIDAVARDRGTGFHEAAFAVKAETEELRSVISTQGCCTIPGIGTLHALDGGSYEFDPIACGIVAPALHGLDSYYVPLYHAKGESAHKEEAKQLAHQDVLTIRLRRSHLRRIAVVAIVCICSALLLNTVHIVPRHNTIGEAGMMQQWWTALTECLQPTRQSLPSINQASTTKPQPKVAKPTTAVPTKATVSTPESEDVNAESKADDIAKDPQAVPTTALPSAPPAKVGTTAPVQGYTIVVASAIPLKNAHAMVDDWSRRGLPKVQTLETSRMVRVVCGTFATEQEARAALTQHRVIYDEFADAWIYHIP